MQLASAETPGVETPGLWDGLAFNAYDQATMSSLLVRAGAPTGSVVARSTVVARVESV